MTERSHRRFAHALALALAAGVLAAPATGRAEETEIQPGAQMTAPGGCTFNFVFRGGSTLYIGTAGHCTGGAGSRVSNVEGQMGTVVYKINSGLDDFSLIRIDADRYDQVNPSVRRWTGPTGYTVSAETTTGDVVMLYGYGIVYGSNAVTRGRPGMLASDDSRSYRAEILVIFGDSGGPVMHASGKALGVVSHLPFGYPAPLEGTTVERILVLLAGAGINVQLVTAPYAGLL